jgi:antitoxin HigA-1
MMKEPVHPGRIIKHECIKALGLTVTQAAEILKVARPNLSKIINGHGGVSPEMAIRLSKAFGGSASVWLRMQMAYDLAQAEKKADEIKVDRYLVG